MSNSTLGSALARRYPEGGYEVRDDSDGRGPYIARWERAEPQPTEAEIVALCAASAVADRLGGLAERRWRAEVSGIVWNGLPIPTGRDDRANIMAEVLAMSLGLRPDPKLWKFADGVARPIGSDDLKAIALAMRAHVQACFDHEAAVAERIRAGEDPDIEAGWPAS